MTSLKIFSFGPKPQVSTLTKGKILDAKSTLNKAGPIQISELNL